MTVHAATDPHDFPAAQSHPEAGPLAVLVIDRDGGLTQPARGILAQAPGLRIVEQGHESAREAQSFARHPDVVLLTVDARAEEAEVVVREFAAKWRPAPMLVLTPCEDRARNRALVVAGARGVVTYSRQAEHLVSALHRVHGREIWLGRGCMSQIIDEMVGAKLPQHLESPAGLEHLTEREREVVALIAKGLHNKAIAVELGITDHTVRHHLTAIFAKLGVGDRLELAVYAFRHGIGTARRR